MNKINFDNISIYNYEEYKESVKGIRNLSLNEEVELFKKMKNNDIDAKNQLFYHYLKLVIINVDAIKMLYSVVDVNDLVQAGNIGLLCALEKFDIEYDVSFSTYARNWILKEVYLVLNFSRNTCFIPSVKVESKINRIKEVLRKAEVNYISLSVSEIAKETNLSETLVIKYMKYLYGFVSIDDEEISEFEDLLFDMTSSLDDEGYIQRIYNVSKKLTRCQKFVFDECCVKQRTCAEVALECGRTKQNVQQIKERVRKIIKDKLV